MQCFVCERQVQVDEQGAHAATIWRTTGNYGSGVYDSLVEGAYLEIAICDECLSARQALVEEVRTAHRVEEVSRQPAELGGVPCSWRTYDGLSDEEVDHLDESVRQRANLTRPSE